MAVSGWWHSAQAPAEPGGPQGGLAEPRGPQEGTTTDHGALVPCRREAGWRGSRLVLCRHHLRPFTERQEKNNKNKEKRRARVEVLALAQANGYSALAQRL